MNLRLNRRNIGFLPVLLSALFFTIALVTIPGHFPGGSNSAFVHVDPSRGPAPAPAPAPPHGIGSPEAVQENPEPKNEPLSDRLVEYHINVQLDADERKLHGSQSITWRNPGSQSVQELYFHLYPNAFRSNNTTFNRESGGKLRGQPMTEDSYGYMEILKVQHSDGQDLSHTMQYIQPDDGNPEDQTLMRIKLPASVAPGETVTLHMEFTVKLPYVYARMGYAGDFVMAGQWFPKLAVYEPKGRRGHKQDTWNLHQYHGNSEFYADFGTYNVKIDVPASYLVAATGFPVNTVQDDGSRRQYHYYAEDVHDFAWAASPHFIYAEEAYSSSQIPGVKIKLYLDPKHVHLEKRYFTVVKRALSSFSEWYGPYPYSTLSVIVPPEGGNGAGGMEYPTLITAWAAKDEEPGNELERVIVHEIGHQFWYGMVANNEFEEAWLDEGFTTYVEEKVMESEYGLSRSLPILSSYITDPAPLKLNAWEYRSHEVYAENVYTRASLVLRDIEETIGTKKMQQVLRTYFHRWKFDHPTTRDFQQVLQDVTHRRWDAYFKQFVYGGMMIDYAVNGVHTYETELNGTRTYETRIHLERLGGVHRPVEIAVKLTDGAVMRESWDGIEQETVLTLRSEQPAAWVLIDPDFKQILENRRYNNFMKAEILAQDEVRWPYGISTFIELVMQLFAW